MKNISKNLKIFYYKKYQNYKIKLDLQRRKFSTEEMAKKMAPYFSAERAAIALKFFTSKRLLGEEGGAACVNKIQDLKYIYLLV